MEENKIELLAPAGNIDSFKAAINSGADAIYMGVDRFNARNMAKNFSLEEYIECIKYAHILNVKVYLTLNTLIYDNEVKDALEMVVKLYSAGLDGVIVQDIGLASLIHKIIPKLPLHASTQMSIYNLEQVKYLEKLGFKRVVLARELTLNEIEYICKNTSLEVEIFVHGALCMCYSGQCILSQVIGGRSANRGNCAQPCRMKYTLCNKKGKIVENRYLLSKKDIFGLDFLQRLLDIGVKSLKIEGRNKTPEYVAGVTKTYRKYIDDMLSKKSVNIKDDDKKYVMQIFNRDGISSGYLDGVRYKDSITENIPKNTGVYLGKVILRKKEYVKVKLETDISLHDGIELLKDNNVIFSNIVTCIKDEDKNILNKKVEKGNVVWLGDVREKIPTDTKIYKTSDYSINNELKKYYNGVYLRKRKIDISLKIKIGEKVLVSVYNLDKNVSLDIDYVPDVAKNKPLTKESVIDAFSKTKDTLFDFNIVKIEMDNNLFIPVSKLNEFRRTLVLRIEELFNKKTDVKENLELLDEVINVENQKRKIDNLNKNILYIYKFNEEIDYIKWYKDTYNKNLDIVYVDICDLYKNKEKIFSTFKGKVEIFVLLPNVGGKNIDSYIFKNLENLVKNGIEGIIVGNIGYIDLVSSLKAKYNLTLIADYSLNIFNKYSALFYTELGFDIICPSLELREEDVKSIDEFANIEVVTDFQTIMTSRYCVLGAYIANRKNASKCSMPCIKDEFYILDSYGKRHDIVCNNLDCVMRIITRRNRFKSSNYRTRHNILYK